MDKINLNLKNKYYILLYLAILCIFTVACLKYEDYVSPFFEIAIFLLIFVIGAFCLYYYTQNENNLHKVAFIINLC